MDNELKAILQEAMETLETADALMQEAHGLTDDMIEKTSVGSVKLERAKAVCEELEISVEQTDDTLDHINSAISFFEEET